MKRILTAMLLMMLVVFAAMTVSAEDGISMYGNSLDALFGNCGTDAATNIGTYFSVTETSYITAVRYYFPNDFLELYGDENGTYTYDFTLKLWIEGSCVYTEVVPATITSNGWYTFNLQNYWAVDTGVAYCASVEKGVMAYSRVDIPADITLGDGFEIAAAPGGSAGAWNNDVNNMPTNSANFNSPWGVDVVRIKRDYAVVEGLLGTPMIGSMIDDQLAASGFGNDAGHNIGMYFRVNTPGVINQVRYFVPNGFTAAHGGSYTFDFVITLYNRDTWGIEARETIPATITADGWYTFTLANPFYVHAGTTYSVGVYKGTNGYSTVEGAFDNLYGKQYFIRPADGLGGWSGAPDAHPNNSYELLGGIFWGTDPVFAPVPYVATVNGIGTWSLDAALAAATEGAVVALLDDATISANTTVPAGVTLDTGDFTLTVDGAVLTNDGILAGTIVGANYGVLVNNGTNNATTEGFVDLSGSIAFKGKLSAFMDSLYIRFYFTVDADLSLVKEKGTIAIKAENYVEEDGLTLDNAELTLVANNTADDQFATLGEFALMQVYARDINVVYKVRPYLVMVDGTVYYGDVEEYGMGVYLNSQISKNPGNTLYLEVLNSLIEYGTAMDAYANRVA